MNRLQQTYLIIRFLIIFVALGTIVPVYAQNVKDMSDAVLIDKALEAEKKGDGTLLAIMKTEIKKRLDTYRHQLNMALKKSDWDNVDFIRKKISFLNREIVYKKYIPQKPVTTSPTYSNTQSTYQKKYSPQKSTTTTKTYTKQTTKTSLRPTLGTTRQPPFAPVSTAKKKIEKPKLKREAIEQAFGISLSLLTGNFNRHYLEGNNRAIISPAFGINYQYRLHNNLYLQSGLQLAGKGSTFIPSQKDTIVEEKILGQYLEYNTGALWYLNKDKKVRPYIQVGALFGIALGGKYSYMIEREELVQTSFGDYLVYSTDKISQAINKDILNETNFGLIGGGGLTIRSDDNFWSTGITYFQGLINTYGNTGRFLDNKIRKQNNLYINLAYYIKIK